MEELKKQEGNYRHTGNLKHGLFVENKSLFNLWQTMKQRCENPKRTKYKDYGGRGIKVCDEWKTAENFIRWALNNGYEKGLQLDRINNDGDYCPNNCRWVTVKENCRNRRNTKWLTVGEEKKCVAEWSELLGISRFTIYWWIREKGIEYAEERIRCIA